MFEGASMGHSFSIADYVKCGEEIVSIPRVFVLVALHMNWAERQGGSFAKDRLRTRKNVAVICGGKTFPGEDTV